MASIKRDYFIKQMQDRKYKTIGKFCNEHGEEFILYRIEIKSLKKIVFITGDEFDWEDGWQYNYTLRRAEQVFHFNQKEIAEIESITKNS